MAKYGATSPLHRSQFHSSKDVTHIRRTDLSEGIEIKFQGNAALVTKKNKQLFVNIRGQKLEDACCTGHHAVCLLLHYTGQNIRKIFFVLTQSRMQR